MPSICHRRTVYQNFNWINTTGISKIEILIQPQHLIERLYQVFQRLFVEGFDFIKLPCNNFVNPFMI